MSNRTDFDAQAVELVELFDSFSDNGYVNDQRVVARLEHELHNAFCAGQEMTSRENGSILSKVNDAIGRAGIHCAIFYWEAIDQIAEERDASRLRVVELERRLGDCLVECDRLLRATSADRVRELEAALQSLLTIRDLHGYQSREEQAIYTTAQVILDK